MAARREVVRTLPKSSCLSCLPSCHETASASPLESALLGPLASVDSKELTEILSPLESTLTKTTGGRVGVPLGYFLSSLRVPRQFPHACQLSPLFSHSCALFGATAAMQLLCNQFVAHSFRRHGGVHSPSLGHYLLSFSPLFLCFAKSRGSNPRATNNVRNR